MDSRRTVINTVPGMIVDGHKPVSQAAAIIADGP